MWFHEYYKALVLFFTKIWVVTDREYASMPKLFHLDDYDDCMLYGNDALYCSISLQLRPEDYNNVSDVWKIMQTVASAKRYYKHDLLRHGICVTRRCPNIAKSGLLKYSPNDVKLLNECYSTSFQNMGLVGEIVNLHCESNESIYSTNTYDFLFAAIILTMVALVLFAWLYNALRESDLQDQTFRNKLFGKYVSSFSVCQNWRRLTRIDLTHPDAKALSCLQAIRLLSVSQVIGSHTLTANMAVPVTNPRYMEHLMDRKIDQFFGLASRFNTMQIFFLMSTWFVTYRFCVDCDGKKATISYLLRRLLNRYLRLTPLMAIVVLFEATWIPHFSNGPLWESVIGMEYNLCRKNWWTNLLYINNFWAFNELCASHLWSLAVDMQFYVTTLLILWFVWHYPKKAPWIFGSIWLLHVFASFYKIGSRPEQYVLSPESTYNVTLVNVADHIKIMNDNTMNIPGLLAGIIYARLFYKYRNQNLFTKKIYVIMWCIVCWSTVIILFIIPGIIINFLDRNLLLLYLYLCLCKTVFIAAIGLFVFGLTQGQGGFIRKICEWPPFYILGRLTYAAYLIHPFFQKYKVAVLRAPNYLSDNTLAFESVGFIVWSFLVAVPVTLFFEMPFEQMRKHMSTPTKKMVTNSDKTE